MMRLLEGFRVIDREALIRSQAYLWLWRTESVQRAFEVHRDELKMLVRYEDLRSDPAPVLARLANWLGLEKQPMLELARRTAVEQMPSEEKGHGRFIRAATPGQWRNNFSAEEQALVHDLLGERLLEVGYSAS